MIKNKIKVPRREDLKAWALTKTEDTEEGKSHQGLDCELGHLFCN